MITIRPCEQHVVTWVDQGIARSSFPVELNEREVFIEEAVIFVRMGYAVADLRLTFYNNGDGTRTACVEPESLNVPNHGA